MHPMKWVCFRFLNRQTISRRDVSVMGSRPVFNSVVVNQGAGCKQIFHRVRELGSKHVSQSQNVSGPIEMPGDPQGLEHAAHEEMGPYPHRIIHTPTQHTPEIIARSSSATRFLNAPPPQKDSPDLIDNLMGWRHSGFHVHVGPRILPHMPSPWKTWHGTSFAPPLRRSG